MPIFFFFVDTYNMRFNQEFFSAVLAKILLRERKNYFLFQIFFETLLAKFLETRRCPFMLKKFNTRLDQSRVGLSSYQSTLTIGEGSLDCCSPVYLDLAKQENMF